MRTFEIECPLWASALDRLAAGLDRSDALALGRILDEQRAARRRFGARTPGRSPRPGEAAQGALMFDAGVTS